MNTKLKQRCSRCAVEYQDLTGSDEERNEKRRKLNQDCRGVEKWYEDKLQRLLHVDKAKAKELLDEHGGPIKFGLHTRKDAVDAETRRVLHLALPEGVGVTETTAKATAAAMAAAAAEPPHPSQFSPTAWLGSPAIGFGCIGTALPSAMASLSLSHVMPANSAGFGYGRGDADTNAGTKQVKRDGHAAPVPASEDGRRAQQQQLQQQASRATS
jgi:hypothetical protein